MVQTQLINSRFAFANAIQNSQHQQLQNIAVLHPAYSNNSSASNNLMSGFTSVDFDLTGETHAPSSHNLEPLQVSRPTQEEEEDEEESRLPPVFANKNVRGC